MYVVLNGARYPSELFGQKKQTESILSNFAMHALEEECEILSAMKGFTVEKNLSTNDQIIIITCKKYDNHCVTFYINEQYPDCEINFQASGSIKEAHNAHGKSMLSIVYQLGILQ